MPSGGGPAVVTNVDDTRLTLTDQTDAQCHSVPSTVSTRTRAANEHRPRLLRTAAGQDWASSVQVVGFILEKDAAPVSATDSASTRFVDNKFQSNKSNNPGTRLASVDHE